MGDSQVIINWEKGNAQVNSLVLIHWMEIIRALINEFSSLNFQNIYRKLNVEADILPKNELGSMDGKIKFQHCFWGKLFRDGVLVFF